MIVDERRTVESMTPTRLLRDLAGTTLEWSEDGFLSRSSTMRDGEQVVARLQHGRSRRGPARLETLAGAWRIHFVSWWNREVIVEPERERGPSVRYHGRWLGRGTVETSGDRDAEWRPTGLLRSPWCLLRGDEVLMRFDVLFSPLRPKARLVIGQAAARWPELDPLVGLGWYLLLKGRRGAH
jgi:hypothetical protein